MAHVLFINDYADEDTDKLNTNFFNSGGSRVIANGKLSGLQLRNAAITVALLEMMLSLYEAIQDDLKYLPILSVICLSMGSFYSLKPFRLSYHGFGEVLQGFSLGFLLPFFGYYYSSNTLHGYPYYTALILFPVFAASNIVHSLPDYPSDKASNRNTFAVQYGEFTARKVVIVSYFVSTFFAVLFKTEEQANGPYLALFLFDCLLLLWVMKRGLFYNSSVTEDRDKCKEFVRLNMFGLLGHIGIWLVSV